MKSIDSKSCHYRAFASSHTHTQYSFSNSTQWGLSTTPPPSEPPSTIPFCPFSGYTLLYLYFIYTCTRAQTFTVLQIFCICDFRSIQIALEDFKCSTPNLGKLLKDCIDKFKDNHRYRNDPRFLKIWFLYVTTSTLALYSFYLNLHFTHTESLT